MNVTTRSRALPEGENLFATSVPDVPDERRTADNQHSPGDTSGSAAPSGTSGTVSGAHFDSPKPAAESGASENRPLIVRGKLRVRGIRTTAEKAVYLESPDLRRFLTLPAEMDAVIEAEPKADFSVVDCDVHHWPQPPSEEELAAYLGAVSPIPDAAWSSHGRGMKLVFIGPHHRDRALAAVFSIPMDFNVELMVHTRHPLSVRSDRPGTKCGRIIFGNTDPQEEFHFRNVGSISPELRQQALDKLGMKLGEHLDHKRCPILPDAASDARDCVVPMAGGVYCHRCAGHGIQYRSGLRAGFVPYSALVGIEVTNLEQLAGDLVHWIHARIVLAYHHCNLGLGVLEEAYRKLLQARYGQEDPRVRQVFNENLDIVWGQDMWLRAFDFTVTKMDTDTANGLPYCQFLRMKKEGEVEVKVDCVRRGKIRNRNAPVGYIPLRPIRGITFLEDASSIPVQAGKPPKYPIKLLDTPLSEEQAFGVVEAGFPRVDRRYLKACIAAGICGERAAGPPPMLTASGPSGSGKGETIRLAASFLGEDAVKVQLFDDPEAFMRNVGMLLAAGHRFIVFDEFGKIPGLGRKLGLLLQIGSVVCWRPLFANHRVSSPCRAAFFFPCVSFPDFLCSSPEFLRRTRHIHLHRSAPNWADAAGGDTTSWRDRTPEHARAANSLLTHVWGLCHECQFRFL